MGQAHTRDGRVGGAPHGARCHLPIVRQPLSGARPSDGRESRRGGARQGIVPYGYQAERFDYFPNVQELRETGGKTNKSTPLLWVNAGASEFKFDITPVTPATEKIGAPSGDEHTGVSDDEEAGASPLPLDVFWLVYRAQKATPDGCLSISHVELTIPLHMGIQVKDATVRAGMKSGRGGVVSTRVPFLTNSGELRRGDVLWHHTD